MNATVVSKLPLPDFDSLIEPSHFSDDDAFDEPDPLSCHAPMRLAKTQPAKKRTRSCLTGAYQSGESGISVFSTIFDEVTPQRILSQKDRVARSEKTDKHELRCPDTPVRTPLRRSFFGHIRPPAKIPESAAAAAATASSSSSGMSLDMVEIVDRLGEGSFGVVYKARYKADDKLYALKVMKQGYVSMPPESGVTRLRFGDDENNDDPYHFSKGLKSESASRMPPASLLLPSDIPSLGSEELEGETMKRTPIPFPIGDDDDEDAETVGESVTVEEEDVRDNVPLSPDSAPQPLSPVPGSRPLSPVPSSQSLSRVSPPQLLSPVSVPEPRAFIPVKNKRVCEAEQQSAISEHPNIVAIKAFWEEPDGHFCILSELCGSSLSTIISKNIDGFDEKTIAGYVRDLLSAVAHIHKHDVIHLDIKPANILISLDSSCLKITDFGQAYKIGSKVKPEEGDGRYMAPELLKDIYTKAADIFSLGITLYEMCIPGLCVPIQGERWDALRHDKIDFRRWGYSQQLQDLIREMLTSDYRKRPSASELLSRDYFRVVLCDSPEVPFCDETASTTSQEV